MLPLRLRLQNFLSYRQAEINFQGLHTVCICGNNGAGKSSLLEALTWVLWGQSRATHDDEVIHGLEAEVRVDLTFHSHAQCYRVIRSRQRKQSTTLEFQIAIEMGDNTPLRFRSLTEKGLRATQQRIIETLKLDYDTFIHSAYLRQGRADEFMLKRPGERKQVLADLLQLEQYDLLAEKAKERSRQFQAQAEVLRHTLDQGEQVLNQRTILEQHWQDLNLEIEGLQHQHSDDRQHLDHLLETKKNYQQSLAELTFFEQQQQRLEQETQRDQKTLGELEAQALELSHCLQQASEIEEGYSHWQRLQREEELMAVHGQQYQALQEKRSLLHRQFDREQQALELEAQRYLTHRQQLTEQLDTLHSRLTAKSEIQAALQTLQQAREALKQFDRLQAQVIPLRQRQQNLNLELQKIKTQVETRLEELRTQIRNLSLIHQQIPALEEQLSILKQDIQELDRLHTYRIQLREKGQERKSFLERLQAHQRDYETQLQDMEQAQQTLEPGHDCPLCHRPLDEWHCERVQQQQLLQRQEIVDMLIVVADQLAVSEREIQVLRQEYRRVDRELKQYPILLEQRGKLQEQYSNALEADRQYQALCHEVEKLDRCQHLGLWDVGIQAELEQIQTLLDQLAYDDRSHGLARGEVDRWRWADLRAAELQGIEKEILKLQEELPQVDAKIEDLHQQQHQLKIGKTWQEIQTYTAQIKALNYDPDTHDRTRQHLRSAQVWPLQYQTLEQARSQFPTLQERMQTLRQSLTQTHQEILSISAQKQGLQHKLLGMQESDPDLDQSINQLQQKIQHDRQSLDQKLAALGRLQQERFHLDRLQTQQSDQQQQYQHAQYQEQLYRELAQAFGKNGVQILLIENLLPHLEAETNAILNRLTGHQLHVQFITQRSARGNTSGDKLIDTLDIRIADTQGTRSYETYSGGEAFRVNFAIRLALARLFAQRSGSPLQLLIVDEGFGTQDDQGCDRLIAAINTIAQDFSCILMITHMPQFKEAFQTRLEVEKTPNGSQVRLIL